MRWTRDVLGFRREGGAGLVALATLLAFLPVLSNGFVAWDDWMNLLYNPNYRGLGWTHLRWMFGATFAGTYEPLAWLSLALDHAIWGLNPLGFHLTNLLLHAANAALFYFVALRFLDGKPAPSLCAALLFSLHPLRVESVAWASERKDVLSGFFYLLSVLAYLRRPESPSPWRWYWACLGAFLLSLLSKASAVSLPAALLILDFYPLRRGGSIVWLEKAPFLLLGILFSSIGSSGFAGIEDFPIPLAEKARLVAASALYGPVFYLRKTLFPSGLSALYPLERPVDFLSAPFILGGAAVIILSVFLWRRRKSFPGALAAWGHFLAALAPNFAVAPFVNHIAADRYTYLSCLGFPLLAARAVRPRPLLAVLAVLGAATWRQCGVWRDSVSLWSHATALGGRQVIANGNLRGALKTQDSPDPELLRLAAGAARRPGDAEALCDLALALAQDGRRGEAAEEAKEADRLFRDAGAARPRCAPLQPPQVFPADGAGRVQVDRAAVVE